MASSDDLIDPILQIATGEMHRRRRAARRFTELELRRRLMLAGDRVEAEVARRMAQVNAREAELLRQHARVLDDGRVALDPAALREVIGEARRELAPIVVEVVLEQMFGSDADEADAS